MPPVDNDNVVGYVVASLAILIFSEKLISFIIKLFKNGK